MFVTKLFESISGKKPVCPRESAAQERHASSLLHPGGVHTPEITPSRVRVVIFKDDKGIKIPMFDSQVHCDADSSKEKEPSATRSLCDMRSSERLEKSTSSVPGTCTWRQTRNRAPLNRRPSSDTELLGEMMFGSMPMKVAGNSIKVHYIRSTDQLMLTKVFFPHHRMMATCTITDFTDSCPLPSDMPSNLTENSLSPNPRNSFAFNLGRASSPQERKPRSSSLNVPISRPNSSMSFHSTRSCSPSPNSHSPCSSVGSLNLSINSSLTRRIRRFRSTSIENPKELYRRVLKPLDQQPAQKGRKYAIGVILCLSELSDQQIRHFQNFFFSHFTLIDAHLEKLKENIEDVCHNRAAFMLGVSRAYQTFLDDFLALYRAPRIEAPVWLALVSQEGKRRAVCMQLMEELGSAIAEFDTKESKFFLSSVLTAVLSHHLAWVYTVTRGTDNRQSKIGSKSLAVLAESHPYNPLWAQLGDLYGAVTNPLKISRTVVTGQHASTVMRILYILTYFIRCSEVQPGIHQETTLEDLPEFELNELHDLEESEVFGESRASSVTVISDYDRHSYASPIPSESPVVKPHPFSFRHQCWSPRGDSQSQSDVDAGEHLYRSGSSAEATSSLKSLRLKSQSLTSNSFEFSPSSHSLSSLKKSSPLLANSRHCIATAGHMTCTTPPNNKRTHPHVVTCSTQPAVFPTKPKFFRTLECSKRDDQPSRCECHFKPTKESCATLASCESMGRCPLNEGYIQFDPTKKYPSDTSQPPRNQSSGSLSDLSHTMSRNTSSNSLAFQTCLGMSPNHVVCGSLDSGYDQSLSTASFTDSTKESCMTDSLLSSNFWKSKAQVAEASKHCSDPEGLNILFHRLKQKGENLDKLERLSTTARTSSSDNSESSSCTGVSNATRQPHSQPDDTDLTPRARRRSGAFSVPTRSDFNDGIFPYHTSFPLRRIPPLCTVTERASKEVSPIELESGFYSPRNGLVSSFEPTLLINGQQDTASLITDVDSGRGTRSVPTCDLLSQYDMVSLSDLASDPIDVEESIMPGSRRILEEKIRAYEQSLLSGMPLTLEQFMDFTEIDLPSLDEFHLGGPEGEKTQDDLNPHGVPDFGHSLMVGHSPKYLPDFVLHGTSEPPSQFQENLVRDLANMVKHSIIDEPIEHGIGIIADTDSWTCRVVAVSKSVQTSDVVVGSVIVNPSRYVRHLMASVKGMWEMRMPPEFCLSHVEDRLLELNEKGIMLANSLSEYGSDCDWNEILPRTLEAMSAPKSDVSLLLSIAGVHCGDHDISARLNYASMLPLLRRQH